MLKLRLEQNLYILLVTTLLDQQGVQFNKVSDRNITSVCGEQLGAQNNATAVRVTYSLCLPRLIKCKLIKFRYTDQIS